MTIEPMGREPGDATGGREHVLRAVGALEPVAPIESDDFVDSVVLLAAGRLGLGPAAVEAAAPPPVLQAVDDPRPPAPIAPFEDAPAPQLEPAAQAPEATIATVAQAPTAPIATAAQAPAVQVEPVAAAPMSVVPMVQAPMAGAVGETMVEPDEDSLRTPEPERRGSVRSDMPDVIDVVDVTEDPQVVEPASPQPTRSDLIDLTGEEPVIEPAQADDGLGPASWGEGTHRAPSFDWSEPPTARGRRPRRWSARLLPSLRRWRHDWSARREQAARGRLRRRQDRSLRRHGTTGRFRDE